MIGENNLGELRRKHFPQRRRWSKPDHRPHGGSPPCCVQKAHLFPGQLHPLEAEALHISAKVVFPKISKDTPNKTPHRSKELTQKRLHPYENVVNNLKNKIKCRFWKISRFQQYNWYLLGDVMIHHILFGRWQSCVGVLWLCPRSPRWGERKRQASDNNENFD